MKTISICQPWAHAVVTGIKRHENRSWPTAYRGPLLIHVSRSPRYLDWHTVEEWQKLLPGVGDPKDLSVGVLLGLVDIVDCLPIEKCRGEPFATGPWCHVYANARQFPEPLPWRGSQGLFEVPASEVITLLTR